MKPTKKIIILILFVLVSLCGCAVNPNVQATANSNSDPVRLHISGPPNEVQYDGHTYIHVDTTKDANSFKINKKIGQTDDKNYEVYEIDNDKTFKTIGLKIVTSSDVYAKYSLK